ncbi:unnamed protein product [Moneuplotes crassus]|uniref:Uncharacterized protein n=1 Tax=Euplotes crassus TaxID=5936 RepID=A0AAD1X6U0_EUPCR|nr:unnamed protein product [Moneuplotes crassus]
MSVYSGFGTRSQETSYNAFLFRLLHACQSKVKQCLLIIDQLGKMTNHKYATIEKLAFQDNFQVLFMKLYTKVADLEQVKYLPPKFSLSVKDLCLFLNTSLSEKPKDDLSEILEGQSMEIISQASMAFDHQVSELEEQTNRQKSYESKIEPSFERTSQIPSKISKNKPNLGKKTKLKFPFLTNLSKSFDKSCPNSPKSPSHPAEPSSNFEPQKPEICSNSKNTQKSQISQKSSKSVSTDPLENPRITKPKKFKNPSKMLSCKDRMRNTANVFYRITEEDNESNEEVEAKSSHKAKAPKSTHITPKASLRSYSNQGGDVGGTKSMQNELDTIDNDPNTPLYYEKDQNQDYINQNIKLSRKINKKRDKDALDLINGYNEMKKSSDSSSVMKKTIHSEKSSYKDKKNASNSIEANDFQLMKNKELSERLTTIDKLNKTSYGKKFLDIKHFEGRKRSYPKPSKLFNDSTISQNSSNQESSFRKPRLPNHITNEYNDGYQKCSPKIIFSNSPNRPFKDLHQTGSSLSSLNPLPQQTKYKNFKGFSPARPAAKQGMNTLTRMFIHKKKKTSWAFGFI